MIKIVLILTDGIVEPLYQLQEGVEIEIRDYDCDGLEDDEEIIEDEYGARYFRYTFDG